jgi:hypothetical protein
MCRVLCKEEFEHWTFVLCSEDRHSHAQRASNRSVRIVARIRSAEFVHIRPNSSTHMVRTHPHMFRSHLHTRPEALANLDFVTPNY